MVDSIWDCGYRSGVTAAYARIITSLSAVILKNSDNPELIEKIQDIKEIYKEELDKIQKERE